MSNIYVQLCNNGFDVHDTFEEFCEFEQLHFQKEEIKFRYTVSSNLLERSKKDSNFVDVTIWVKKLKSKFFFRQLSRICEIDFDYF